MEHKEQRSLHLVGTHVTHSVAYRMHNYIAESLGLPWTFCNTTCPTLDDALTLLAEPTVAGLVVTMPYKNTIMERVDELDELASTVGACNCVYYKKGKDFAATTRISCGSNTDWNGIVDSLLGKQAVGRPRPSPQSPGCAVVVGAGGASRAAVYSLAVHLHCDTIYIINRDAAEVAALVADSKKLANPPRLIRLETAEEARKLPVTPYYVVGTVPDFEPQTEEEKRAAATLDAVLDAPEKGVLLDLCFKPRWTRMMKAGERKGWQCVEGIHVIGHQVIEQWRLWVGDKAIEKSDRKGAWAALMKAAEESKEINF